MAEKSTILDWLGQGFEWIGLQLSGLYHWMFGGQKAEAASDAPFSSFSAAQEMMNASKEASRPSPLPAEYLAQREQWLRELAEAMKRDGIAIDDAGNIDTKTLREKGEKLPLIVYAEAKDGKLPLESVARYLWAFSQVLQGDLERKNMGFRDLFEIDAFKAMKEAGGHLKMTAHDSEGNALRIDSDAAVSQVTCRDGSQTPISPQAALAAVTATVGKQTAAPPSNGSGKSLTVEQGSMTDHRLPEPMEFRSQTVPLGDLPSPLQEACANDKSQGQKR